jgi:hypothetical protein
LRYNKLIDENELEVAPVPEVVPVPEVAAVPEAVAVPEAEAEGKYKCKCK